MKIVVTGLIATYPLGGVAWAYLAYVEGLRRLGHEVFYLEDTGQWLYDPGAHTFTDDVARNVAHLQSTLRRAGNGPPTPWSLRAPDGAYHGAGRTQVERFCNQADLFLNVSGACWLRDEYRGARRIAYLDTDPGYSQATLAAVEEGNATEAQAYSVRLIRAHHCFLTFAENINDPSCSIPRGGVTWKPTRQPVVIAHWPFTYDEHAPKFTTVMSWRTQPAPPRFGGRVYGGKDVEFLRFLELPRRVRDPLEVAVSGVAPRDRLVRAGWHVADAGACSATMDRYRRYLGASRGEWSIAKHAYVATASGWFSDRSAAYLAMGKPVVLQDTGFSRHYPTGQGIWSFRTTAEAAAAIAAVDRNYRQQCEAARALAEHYFRSDAVLERLLQDVGL